MDMSLESNSQHLLRAPSSINILKIFYWFFSQISVRGHFFHFFKVGFVFQVREMNKLWTLLYLCFPFSYQIGLYPKVHFYWTAAFPFKGAQRIPLSELRRGRPSGWRLLCLHLVGSLCCSSQCVAHPVQLRREPESRDGFMVAPPPAVLVSEKWSLNLMLILGIVFCHIPLFELDWIMKYQH